MIRKSRGKVYIVGAGPGDPKLLTLRALEVIRSADTVLYDDLVSKGVLRLLPKRSEKISVGKSHTGRARRFDQAGINEILVSESKKGKIVIRLKGGDPLIFARGGEEVEVLKTEGIRFEIVSGISSALAAPAYAGIPLTHRSYSSSVAIVTGHETSSKGTPKVNLSGIARNVETLIILMGVATLGRNCNELISAGLSPDTPVAAIEWATTRKQRTTLFTLGEGAQKRVSKTVKPPSVIIVGRTVALASQLGWFRLGAVDVSPRFRTVWAK